MTSPASADDDPTIVEIEPSPYRARAWWGAARLADSEAAVRVDRPDRGPLLLFPGADVRLDLLVDRGERRSCPLRGELAMWSAPRAPQGEPPTVATGADDWWSTEVDRDDGTDVAWQILDPPTELGWAAGHVGFDPERVRVELVDAAEGDDPADVTVKRFPTWGDAAHLVDVMDVRAVGAGRYVTATRSSHRRPVVEASQMLGQSIVAASRHTGGRRVVSAHMAFTRPGDARRPLDIELDEVSHGRTFSAVGATVRQDGRTLATGTLLLDATGDDVMTHSVAPPEVPRPHELTPYDMSVTGRDLRIVDDAYTSDPDAPVGPPEIDAWVRFRHLPDDPALHAGLLAQFTGHLSIAAAMRPHAGIGQREAHRTLSTAINAIGISFHADVRADRWMLYHHLSTFVGGGMSHAECRVHDEAGALLASFTVDAMIRPLSPSAGAGDETRAL